MLSGGIREPSVHRCTVPEESEIRLRGTKGSTVGHVEICHECIWGLVCGDHWTKDEASVVCRQLNLKEGWAIKADDFTHWESNGSYNKGPGMRKLWLSHAYCKGSEARLIDCRYGPERSYPLTISYRWANQRVCFQNGLLVGVSCGDE